MNSASNLTDSQIEELHKQCADELTAFSESNGKAVDYNHILEKYIELLSMDFMGYHQKLMRQHEDSIVAEFGDHVNVVINKMLVCNLYLRNINRIEDQKVPKKVRHYLQQDFKRIFTIAVKGRSTELSFKKNSFTNYIEELVFKRLPLGNQSIVLAGIPRSIIFKQSPINMLKFLALLVVCKGNSPFFELHFNPHRRRLFTPEGWEEVFQLATGVLNENKHVRGIFGATWFFDPAIKEISNELYYIAERIIQIGGKIFFCSQTEADRKDAFAFSAARKSAYEEGRYIPRGYVGILSRQVLLKQYATQIEIDE